MKSDEMQASDEPSLEELFALLWNSKLLIVSVTILALALGGIAYVLVPRTFVSKVLVYPVSQAKFTRYLGLSLEGNQSQEVKNLLGGRLFPYTPATLLIEYSLYLRDTDKLIALAKELGVVERGTMSDEAYDGQIQHFVSNIKVETSKLQGGGDQSFLIMEGKARNQGSLLRFMGQALKRANVDMAEDLTEEIQRRSAAVKDQLNTEIVKLRLDIDAHRRRAESERNDDVTRMAEQSTIAHFLGIQKSLDLRAIEAIERGNNAPTQIINSGEQPPYMRGYAALDKFIEALRDRKNSDPFTTGLRQLQQQIDIIENNPLPSRILTLLKQSPLANPGTAELVSFSTASISAEKTFPKLSMFGIGSLFLGLMLGSAIALTRRGKPASAIK